MKPIAKFVATFQITPFSTQTLGSGDDPKPGLDVTVAPGRDERGMKDLEAFCFNPGASRADREFH